MSITELWMCVDRVIVPAIPTEVPSENKPAVPSVVHIWDKICVDDGLLTKEKLEKYSKTFKTDSEIEYNQLLKELKSQNKMILSKHTPADALNFGHPLNDAPKMICGK